MNCHVDAVFIHPVNCPAARQSCGISLAEIDLQVNLLTKL
jgi:hypothetical protein